MTARSAVCAAIAIILIVSAVDTAAKPADQVRRESFELLNQGVAAVNVHCT